MRKSSESPRFPQSAHLFKFCLRVLETRKGSRAHDQEVGNILNYNPSDTSHWKRGKKAVRNIYALEILADTLQVSLELIQDLADNLIDVDEAWYEFEEAEELKKANAALTPELKLERQRRLIRIESLAARMISEANIRTVPVFLPEIAQNLPTMTIVQGDVAEKIARSSKGKPGTFLIRYRKGEMNAHTRAAIAREVARVILFSEREKMGLLPKHDGLEFLEMIDLSNALLVPKQALKSETQEMAARADLIKALGEIFWVPKSVIRSRLKQSILEGMSEVDLLENPVIRRELTGAVRRPHYPMTSGFDSNQLLEEDSVSEKKPLKSTGPSSESAALKEPH